MFKNVLKALEVIYVGSVAEGWYFSHLTREDSNGNVQHFIECSFDSCAYRDGFFFKVNITDCKKPSEAVVRVIEAINSDDTIKRKVVTWVASEEI